MCLLCLLCFMVNIRNVWSPQRKLTIRSDCIHLTQYALCVHEIRQCSIDDLDIWLSVDVKYHFYDKINNDCSLQHPSINQTHKMQLYADVIFNSSQLIVSLICVPCCFANAPLTNKMSRERSFSQSIYTNNNNKQFKHYESESIYRIIFEFDIHNEIIIFPGII